MSSINYGVAGRITPPKDAHVLVDHALGLVDVVLQGKRDFGDRIKVASQLTLKWGAYPGLSERAQCNHKSP